MKIYDYPSEAAEKKLATIVSRGLNFKKKDVSAVNRILEDVRRNGDAALIKYVNRFDAPGLQTGSLAVTESEFREATRQVDAAFRRALNRATAQIESFHRLQLPKSWINTIDRGLWSARWSTRCGPRGFTFPEAEGARHRWSLRS